MSFRVLPTRGDELRSLLRDMLDRLDRVERGGLLLGRVSFDSVIQIGDVEVSILDGAGNQRIVQFRNVLSGATSTITL